MIDGLSVEEAIGLACRRHNELKSDDLKFLQRITGNAELKKSQEVRLTGIIRRLRQQLDFTPAAERAPP